MNRTRPLIMLPAMAMLAAACATSPASFDSRAVEGEIRERSLAVGAAEAAEDLERIMVYWSPDAVVHIDSMSPIVGHAALRRTYEQLFPAMDIVRTETSLVRVARSGELAYETGINYLRLKSPSGSTAATSKFLTVWERGADGQWRIAAISVTNNPTE